MKHISLILLLLFSIQLTDYSSCHAQGVDIGLEVGLNLDGTDFLWGGTATREQELAGQNLLFGFALDCYLIDNARFLFSDFTASYQFPTEGSIKPYAGGGLFFTRWSYKNDYEFGEFGDISEAKREESSLSFKKGNPANQIVESSAVTNSGLLAKAGATFSPRSRFIPFAEALFLFEGSQFVLKTGFRVKIGSD